MSEQTVAGELIEKGLTIARIENDSIQAMAIQNKRNEVVVAEGALQELEIFPEYASKAFYSIPYKNDKGGTTNVEGPSIKSAMALARRWGNCSNAGRIVSEDDERVVVEGVFIDHQTNIRTMRQVSVPKVVYSKYDKSFHRIRPDRMQITLQAGISKAVRNAILASLPFSLVDAFVAKAKELINNPPKKRGAGKPKALTLNDLKKEFMRVQVSPKMFDEYVAGTTFETNEEVVAHMVGLLNSIKDGQTRVEDIFTAPEQKQEKGQISLTDMMGK